MTFMLGSESSTVLSLPGTKVPPIESTRERKFHNSQRLWLRLRGHG